MGQSQSLVSVPFHSENAPEKLNLKEIVKAVIGRGKEREKGTRKGKSVMESYGNILQQALSKPGGPIFYIHPNLQIHINLIQCLHCCSILSLREKGE